MLRIALASVHLIALGLGLGAVLGRGTALREVLAPGSLRRAFRADAVWGISFGLWLLTGLWRLFAETEKSVGYYMVNHAFFAKMGFLGLILALEIWPMVTLIRWRGAIGRGEAPETVADVATARRIATISHVQATLVVLMVFAAVAMARGYGAIRTSDASVP
jgi:putative membrane protein